MAHLADPEDWSDLDAMVGAELDIALARRPRPAGPADAKDALFVDQATAFLRRHDDPHRLIALLTAQLTDVRGVPDAAAPAPLPAEPPPIPAAAPSSRSDADSGGTSDAPE